MTSQQKLIAGTVAVALLAGGGAALAAVELSSSSPAATPAVTAPLASGIGSSYGLGAGRFGGRGLGGGLGPGDDNGGDLAGDGRFFGRAGLATSLGAASTYLGVPVATLRADLVNGQTLAQVAKAQGKALDGLVAAMVAVQKRAVAQAVTAGVLTQAQADLISANLETRTRAMANGLRPGRFDGGFPGAPGGGSGSSGSTDSFGSTA